MKDDKLTEVRELALVTGADLNFENARISRVPEQVIIKADAGTIRLTIDIKEKLESAWFSASLADSLMLAIIHLPYSKVDMLPPKLRDRVATLVARKNFCPKFERAILDWMLIELVWPFREVE